MVEQLHWLTKRREPICTYSNKHEWSSLSTIAIVARPAGTDRITIDFVSDVQLPIDIAETCGIDCTTNAS
jgi:hypothetical protein